MRALAERVKQRMAQASAVIESQSGEAMQNAVSPVVLWTEVAADNADAQVQAFHDQAQAFSTVQHAIPSQSEEKPAPDENWLESGWHYMVNGKTDTEAANQHNEQLRQQAVQAFNTYQNTSQNTVAATPVFTAPPPVGMETSVSSTPQSQVGTQNASFSKTPGSQPSGTQSSWSGSLPPGGSVPPGGYTPPAGTNPVSSPPVGTNPVWSTPTLTQPPGSLTPGSQPPGGAGGPGAVGGIGTGAGAGGSGRGAGSGTARPGAGAGGRGGAGRGGVGAGGRGGAAGAGAAGGRGANGGMGGPARGKGQEGEEDAEHYTPEFLKGDHGFFDDDMPKVAPPVLGEQN